MKQYFIFIFFIGFMMLYTSCKKNDYASFLKVKSKEKFSHEIKQLKAIIILPNQGCDGCITEVEHFLINSFDKCDNSIFILTKIVSHKILRQKLGDSIYYAANVYVDSTNFFSATSYKEVIYPAILYIKKGDIVDVKYQNPDSPAAIAVRLSQKSSRYQ
jgi:hypothetical protein